MLFEALAMSNQVGVDEKLQGDVIIFRDLRENIKNTVKLFSDNCASEDTVFKDYDYYLSKYNENFDNFEKLKYYYEILTTFEEFDFDKS